MAYKLISRNQPLPDHVKLAMIGKQPPKILSTSGGGAMPSNVSPAPPQVPTSSQTSTATPTTPASVAPNQTAYNVPGMTQCKFVKLFVE